jgi:two-component system chemotaxis response regulator CheB
MERYRVLVVDDSAFMRKMVSDLIEEDSRFIVVAAAKNGLEAIGKTKELKPDVVTMDVEMPVMNGLQALRSIMREHPVPVVMLSSLTEEGAKETIEALALGAIDFVQKPSGPISLDIRKVGEQLREKLHMAVRIKPKLIPAWSEPAALPRIGKKAVPVPSGGRTEPFKHIIAIGTSTGGPRALQQVIPRFPAHFPAPILVVQHMPPHFTKSLAARLDMMSELKVSEAVQDGVIAPGHAYIAPGGWHMTVHCDESGIYRIRLNQDAPRHGHRPAVDVLFESLLPFRSLVRHAVLMTGMGSDGALGMKALHADGAESTIAESRETCVVYGMPRAAVELQCVSDILPLHRIPDRLIGLVMTPGSA